MSRHRYAERVMAPVLAGLVGEGLMRRTVAAAALAHMQRRRQRDIIPVVTRERGPK
jgi:hypothetical protein